MPGQRSDEFNFSFYLKLIDFEKDFNRFPRRFVSLGCTFMENKKRCHSDGSNSLFPECQTACAGLISTWISSFPSSLFKAIGPLSDSIWYSWGALSWIGIVMISYQISAIGWLETLVLVKEGESRFKRVSRPSYIKSLKSLGCLVSGTFGEALFLLILLI